MNYPASIPFFLPYGTTDETEVLQSFASAQILIGGREFSTCGYFRVGKQHTSKSPNSAKALFVKMRDCRFGADVPIEGCMECMELFARRRV